jgi:hypothetical protein
MPSRSKQQYRFMKAIESGSIKKPGLSKEEAKDFTEGMTKQRFKKLKKYVEKK